MCHVWKHNGIMVDDADGDDDDYDDDDGSESLPIR
jgi:hypothetical protein